MFVGAQVCRDVIDLHRLPFCVGNSEANSRLIKVLQDSVLWEDDTPGHSQNWSISERVSNRS